MYNSDTILFEIEDNFQKQTYRNRCYIYGANGKQLLNVPLSYPKTTTRKKTKDILVEDSDWQKQHFKSLKTAYNHSPFFEFYKDDLELIFTKKYKYLLDLNIDSFLFINDALELYKKHKTTNIYKDKSINDYRFLANSKKAHSINLESYIQVFSEKYGFLKNLSILDLLFMEGPNSISFLEKVNVTLE